MRVGSPGGRVPPGLLGPLGGHLVQPALLRERGQRLRSISVGIP
jgi:hypothetical protein